MISFYAPIKYVSFLLVCLYINHKTRLLVQPTYCINGNVCDEEMFVNFVNPRNSGQPAWMVRLPCSIMVGMANNLQFPQDKS